MSSEFELLTSQNEALLKKLEEADTSMNAAQMESIREQVEDSLLELQATVDELAGFSDEEPVQAPIPD